MCAPVAKLKVEQLENHWCSVAGCEKPGLHAMANHEWFCAEHFDCGYGGD
jgi:hypothetical protein